MSLNIIQANIWYNSKYNIDESNNIIKLYGKAKTFGINVMYVECVAEFSDR